MPADRASPDRARLAAQALADAKADARARGEFASPRGGDPPGDPPVTSPARRQRRDDPGLLAGAIDGLLDAHGWQQQAAMGSVFGRWAEIVGQDLAAHTSPESFADGELAVSADSTAWAT